MRIAVFAATVEVYAHTLGFIRLERTGVRLFLSHADIGQYVQNCPALYFELAC
jgi:hypothetical protein